uniref:Non-specific protein-tyrosine kinase n=1 Tax=Wuchereria bancrofti TaxID=6293 RepID=A0A1I8EAT2_WUCBA
MFISTIIGTEKRQMTSCQKTLPCSFISKSIKVVGPHDPTKPFKKQDPIGPFVGKVLVKANDNLLSETYYHGIVNCVDVGKLLIRDGDFLFGIPEEDEEESIVWVVRYNRDLWAFNIGLTEKGLYFVNQKCFKKISEMVSDYIRTRKPIHETLPIVVKRPVPHPAWVVSHDRVRLKDELGEGAFGRVYKGILQVGHTYMTVAAKTCVGQASDKTKRASFLQEAKVMRDYKHENLVQFIGIACQKEPLMIIVEFCGGGSLLKYLRKKGAHLGIATRYRFGKEASAGLKYLEEKRCIHRDVAARNCLLTEHELTLKICDFGLSIREQQISNSEIQLPTKWLSPEAIKSMQFTTKSDVWAFGVLLYEIFTDGSEPYHGHPLVSMSNAQVREKLTDGSKYRMEIPLDVPPGIMELIKKCWMEETKQRPTFKEINRTLTKIAFA